MSDKAMVELDRVYFTYGCHPVLDRVSLKVFAGESVGITGPNGAGKTTLLKLILGRLRPQRGSVRVFGVESTKLKRRPRLGYISQNVRLFNRSFPATAREVVATGRVAVKGPLRRLKKEDFRAVDGALEQVGMLERAHQLIGTMSGGQQQRVFLARALAGDPLLLVMDEPAVGLDVEGRRELYEILSALNDKEKVTLILVSHETEEIAPLIKRRVCLDGALCSCRKDKFGASRPPAGGYCAKEPALV